jgi:hypothetical protein
VLASEVQLSPCAALAEEGLQLPEEVQLACTPRSLDAWLLEVEAKGLCVIPYDAPRLAQELWGVVHPDQAELDRAFWGCACTFVFGPDGMMAWLSTELDAVEEANNILQRAVGRPEGYLEQQRDRAGCEYYRFEVSFFCQEEDCLPTTQGGDHPDDDGPPPGREDSS